MLMRPSLYGNIIYIVNFTVNTADILFVANILSLSIKLLARVAVSRLADFFQDRVFAVPRALVTECMSTAYWNMS